MCTQITADNLSNTQVLPTKLKHLNVVCPHLVQRHLSTLGDNCSSAL